MKIYKVKVNGKLYEVEVEAVDETEKKAEPAPVKEEVKVRAEEGEKQILAPIAGKILDVVVKKGDSIRKGQTVAIIEAMKLENEIQSAYEGTVKQSWQGGRWFRTDMGYRILDSSPVFEVPKDVTKTENYRVKTGANLNNDEKDIYIKLYKSTGYRKRYFK